MNQGAPGENPDETDNGVVIEEGNAPEKVYIEIPPRPPLPPFPPRPARPPFDDNTDTPAMGVTVPEHLVDDAAFASAKLSDLELMQQPGFRNRVYDDGAYLGTRRHWREPVLRLLRPQSERAYEKNYASWTEKKKKNPLSAKRPPQRYGPFWYWFSVYGSIIAIVVLVILSVDSSEYGPWALLSVLVGGGLLAYCIGREWFRWRKRTVLIRHIEAGLRITWGEPDNILLGFNGTRNGHFENIEGSSSLTPLISWPNRLIFWGCGDLDVGSKIESGGAAPLLQNIPRVKMVHKFASRDTEDS